MEILTDGLCRRQTCRRIPSNLNRQSDVRGGAHIGLIMIDFIFIFIFFFIYFILFYPFVSMAFSLYGGHAFLISTMTRGHLMLIRSLGKEISSV